MGQNSDPRSDQETFDDDGFEPLLGDLDEIDTEEVVAAPTSRAELMAKRKRAEQRLEALRLREELGDYDFDFDDY